MSAPRRLMLCADLAVVGGGIVGLASARAFLQRFPCRKVVVLEKETAIGTHQSSHNSGVIHSGIYYRPGSLKAAACLIGADLLIRFCEARGIPYRLSGKVIVATETEELPALHRLYEQGLANGVRGLSLVDEPRLRQIEPFASGLKGLHVASAGVVDFAAVARVMASEVRRMGAEIRTSARVKRIIRTRGRWVVETPAGDVEVRCLVSCAGLHADQVTAISGGSADVQIVPFRGEYYDLSPSAAECVRSMIYPVPNPHLPFLGVHLTKAVDGRVHAGPNAVLALKREGYRKRDVSPADLFALLRFPGFWRMAKRHWRAGVEEVYRSLDKRAFVRTLQRLVPCLTETDLTPGKSGVRAQAVDRNGRLLDDFDIVQGVDVVHVRNVPSPAATASFRIGQMIAEKASVSFAP